MAPKRDHGACEAAPTSTDAVQQRPRERLLLHGAQALSSSELLTIVLRGGASDRSAVQIAEALLRKLGGLRRLQRATVRELGRAGSLSPARSAHLAACLELGRRAAVGAADPPRAVQCPEDVADLVRAQQYDARQEHFFAVLLDTKNVVTAVVTVSVGTLDSSLVHPREVFREAVKSSAAAVVVAHNHPSGDPGPSLEDRQVTARLVEAGRLLGIELLDHVIVGEEGCVSLKRQGLM